MSSTTTALIALGCVYGGALVGLTLRNRLPEHHLSPESQDTVKLVTGLVATLTAMVLGLLIASAKSSLDAVDSGMKRALASVIVADRLLAEYGPEAAALRAQLKVETEAGFGRLHDRPAPADAISSAGAARFDAGLHALAPADDRQRALLARIETLSDEVRRTHWLVLEQADDSVPPLFLVVIVTWLATMFVSFGLFAPRNPTTLSALFIAALAVATAILLIEEMYRPLDGLISVSPEPVRQALAQLGR